ncbi:sensor histidine kinase [Saccharothrix syringae]|uniref:histidine kinase n=1 Tax=Saccharothrix syringae TaxID=103733 RepID=A0A5Q0H2Q4_SACSY|nr:HAMP domain-containing sensor histidine kinase [Saccharothrix syringae]QFZ20100.1 HAMP domain-containing histidine kinase [Saccharothrix syringae]
MKKRRKSIRAAATLAVTTVVALPLVVAFVVGAVFLRKQADLLREQAEYWEAVPERRVVLCSDPDSFLDAMGTRERLASGAVDPPDDHRCVEYARAQALVPVEGNGSADRPPGSTDAPSAPEALYTRDYSGAAAYAQNTLTRPLLVLAMGCIGFCALVGSAVWVTCGRLLRPVEAIRREMADITEHDLARRVPVPRGRAEITTLAETVNATLDRLQHAVEENQRFVADASHELRSPIAALRAELEIATTHPGLTDWPEVVDAALADTERLQHLATDLLLLARLDHALTATPVDSHTAIDGSVDLGALTREHTDHRRSRHTLTTDLPDVPAPVRGSRALLDRLLGNLLDNAERHATTTITIRLSTADGQAILEVLDDGPGIPPEDRERIFDRFTRLDDARTRDTGGTGLGLPIARRIVTNHAGTLQAVDPDVGGARFVVTLPLIS